LIVITKF